MDRDPAYLLDMLIAARDVQVMSAGLTEDQFNQSKLHQLALIKLIENIGEAARAISEKTKAAHPEIPWVTIIDMRNHLIHRYFQTDLHKVWLVIENHIGPLITNLEPLVPLSPP